MNEPYSIKCIMKVLIVMSIEIILCHQLQIENKITIKTTILWLQYELVKMDVLIKLMKKVMVVNSLYD